jgi:hypothetical protein
MSQTVFSLCDEICHTHVLLFFAHSILSLQRYALPGVHGKGMQDRRNKGVSVYEADHLPLGLQ